MDIIKVRTLILSYSMNTELMHVQYTEGSPTVAKSRTLPTEILFEINEITRFSKSEIKKIGMKTSKIL